MQTWAGRWLGTEVNPYSPAFGHRKLTFIPARLHKNTAHFLPFDQCSFIVYFLYQDSSMWTDAFQSSPNKMCVCLKADRWSQHLHDIHEAMPVSQFRQTTRVALLRWQMTSSALCMQHTCCEVVYLSWQCFPLSCPLPMLQLLESMAFFFISPTSNPESTCRLRSFLQQGELIIITTHSTLSCASPELAKVTRWERRMLCWVILLHVSFSLPHLSQKNLSNSVFLSFLLALLC